MKLKNRQDDASALEWLRTYDWFAELRDDPAEPADHGLAEPADDSGPRPETTAAPSASWPAAWFGPGSATSCGGRSRGAKWVPASGTTPIRRRLAKLTSAPARSQPAGASMPSAAWPAPDASRPVPTSGPPTRLPCGTVTTPSPRLP